MFFIVVVAALVVPAMVAGSLVLFHSMSAMLSPGNFVVVVSVRSNAKCWQSGVVTCSMSISNGRTLSVFLRTYVVWATRISVELCAIPYRLLLLPWLVFKNPSSKT
jgi:hypothetical protein